MHRPDTTDKPSLNGGPFQVEATSPKTGAASSGTQTSRRIFRRWLSKFIKVQLNFRGYFDLYNIPFKYIHLFDFTEKKSPLQPRGMNRGPNIFDRLEEQEIPYFVSNPSRTEEQNRDAAAEAIRDAPAPVIVQPSCSCCGCGGGGGCGGVCAVA